MGFVITKILLWLILPPASLLILMALGFLIVRFCRGFGRLLIATGFILLYLLSIGPVAEALLKPLETSSPPWKGGPVRADAIVVLGGGVKDLSWLKQPPQPTGSSLERLVEGARLYRSLRLRLVLMGGSGDPSKPAAREADAMAQTAIVLGVPSKDVIVESKSRNTLESAKSLKSLIKGNRIILVTAASHMKRASAMFAKQGVRVIPAPTEYLLEESPLSFYSFIPQAYHLGNSSAAIYEYLALSWYSLHGEI